MLKEFRTFIAKGNVLDLAVAVIIGAAFAKIVDSLVKDIFTPILSLFTKNPNLNFSQYQVGPFLVGDFINAVIQFLIVAFALFLIVKAVNHARTRAGLAAAAKVDHNATIEAQNARIIELLEQMNAR